MTIFNSFPFGGKKATDLTAASSPLVSTQLFFVADPTTGAMKRATLAQILGYVFANITSSIITTALGYTPLSGITGAMVISALGYTPQPAINTNTVLTMDGRPDVYAGIILMDSNGAHWKLIVNTGGGLSTEHVGYNEGGEYYFGEP